MADLLPAGLQLFNLRHGLGARSVGSDSLECLDNLALSLEVGLLLGAAVALVALAGFEEGIACFLETLPYGVALLLATVPMVFHSFWRATRRSAVRRQSELSLSASACSQRAIF